MAGLNFGNMVDTAEMPARGGLIPEGTYTAEVKEATVGETMNGNEKFALTFVIVEGEEAGRKVFNDIVTPREGTDEKARRAQGIFLDKLYTLGLSKTFVKSNPSLQQVADALVGKRADIVVYIDRTYNPDKPKAKVRYINRPSVPAPAVGPAPVGGFQPVVPAAAPRPAPAVPPAGFNAGPVISVLNTPRPTPPPVPTAAPAAAVEESAPAGPPVPVEF